MPNRSSLRKRDESEGVSLLTGVVATSAPSLRTGEALITVTLLSLGLWGGLYVAAYWLSELVLPR